MVTCTYCGGTQFHKGPSGGLAVNVLCANPDCRHWFNHTPFGLDDLNRVEPTPEHKAQLELDERVKVAIEREERQNIGRDHYRAGHSFQSVWDSLSRYGSPYSDYTYVGREFMDLLTGFLDAMAEDARNVPPREGG